MMIRNFYELTWVDFSFPRVIGKTKKLKNSEIKSGVKNIIKMDLTTLNSHKAMSCLLLSLIHVQPITFIGFNFDVSM